MSTPENPEESALEQHRSLADGDLHTAWNVRDFFGSLNNVMRLPEKVAARVAARRAQAKTGDPQQFRLPKPAVFAMLLVSFCVLVGGPLLASLKEGDGVEKLAPAIGVWNAGAGRYAGRVFELTDSTVAFSTSAKGEFQRYRIDLVRTQGAVDSTLYTVTYQAATGPSDFAFWLLPPGGLIRFKNTPETVWTRTGLSLPTVGNE
ncbi:MAG TPA: hypothetical protein VLK88_04515 [Gemmatimonadales bacterium]|nr:hypothetical protein [Gemmatimonadales bacterium]